MLQSTLDACQPEHPTSVLIVHGTSDLVLPYFGNAFFPSVDSAVNYWLTMSYNTINPLPIESVFNPSTDLFRYLGGENNSAQVELHHYRVNGGGHSWFDFSNEVIIDFFSSFDKYGVMD